MEQKNKLCRRLMQGDVKMFKKNFVILCLTLVIGTGIFIVRLSLFSSNSLRRRCPVTRKEHAGQQLNELLRIGHHIAVAHRHARSGKAVLELNKAYDALRELLASTYNEILNETLPMVPAGPEMRTQNVMKELPDVCDEYYAGNKHGYPWYFHGWVVNSNNCTAKPIKDVVSVLVNAKAMPNNKLRTLLKGLRATYPTVRAVVAATSHEQVAFSEVIGAKVVEIGVRDTDGSIWKKLAKAADTKYVLLARNLNRFDNQSNLERLIRLASFVDNDIVGGSFRFGDGRWFRGCHQMALRNYTLKLVEGYDFAYNSCIYCNYIPGPFLIRPEMFTEYVDEYLDGEFVFLDLFMQRFQDEAFKQMVCPDVMFSVDNNEMHLTPRTDWIPLAKKWTLNRVIFTNNQEIAFSCEESDSKCSWTGGLVLPICCTKELADSTKYLGIVSEQTNGTVELEAGSAVGAVKMYGVLPWERDQDFNWLADDNEEAKLMNLHDEFKKRGYRLVPEKTDYAKCYRERTSVNCGYMALRTTNWRLEMWGVIETGASLMAHELGVENVTRILFDGMWMKTHHNPALSVRNQYGDDTFEHVEHWITLGKSTGWDMYATGKYLPCPKPGFNGCLDKYLPVGNIQFQDLYV